MRGLKNQLYIPSLTGIRAVAATMVFLSHLWMIFPVQNPLLLSVFQQLHIGVTFFFVLSGFLMGYLHQQSFSFQKNDIIRFYVKKLLRLYPVYIIITLFVLLQSPTTVLTWIVNVFALKGFFLAHHFAGIAPAWTVTVDVTFYLLLPLIFFFWKKTHWVVQVIAFYIVGLLLFLIGSLLQWQTFCSTIEFVLFSTFFGRAFEFLGGITLGVFLAKKKILKQEVLFPIKTIIGIVFISIGVWILVVLKQSDYQGLGLLNPWGIITNNYLIAGGVLLLIWGLTCENSLLERLLASKVMVMLGKASYGFFLIHYTVMSLGIYHFVNNNFWIFFVCLWGVSYLLHRYIEEPMARFRGAIQGRHYLMMTIRKFRNMILIRLNILLWQSKKSSLHSFFLNIKSE